MLHKAAGCRECRNFGYKGRQGLFELMVTTEEVRQLAHDRASSWKIAKAAKAAGMINLRDDGWHKVVSGITTVDEILRVTKGEVQLQ